MRKIRFILVNHSTSNNHLVEIISTHSGVSCFCAKAGIDDIQDELWKCIGINKESQRVFKATPQQRVKIKNIDATKLVHAWPHELEAELRCIFMSDIMH